MAKIFGGRCQVLPKNFLVKIHIWHQKNSFCEKTNFRKKIIFGGGVDPGGIPGKKFFLGVRIRFLDQRLEKNVFWGNFLGRGVGTPSAPKFGDPLIYQLGIDIWAFCERCINIGCWKAVLHATERTTICNGRTTGLRFIYAKTGQNDTFWALAAKPCPLTKKWPEQTLTGLDRAIARH